MMSHSRYLIIGSSHAGLSAMDAIRTQDGDGSITLLTQENVLPYSPTILPYVVSGQADPDKIFLRDERTLDRLGVDFRRGERAVRVAPQSRTVFLESGDLLEYDKLCLATGAAPVLPPIEGLKEGTCYVLRSLKDALRLRKAAGNARSAIVLGAGLIGMHGAENLAKGGLKVTVVEALSQVLPGYFDQKAAGLIREVFVAQGVDVLMGSPVTHVEAGEGICHAVLETGRELSADLLLVATGVRPRTDFLAGSGLETDAGILVDDHMRAGAEGVWAAGDVAQASAFFESAKIVNATLLSAVEQGRLAGMDMVGDPALKPYAGGISMNTYRFFGHRAFSVGLGAAGVQAQDLSVEMESEEAVPRYRKLVFQDDRLVGVSGINSDLDPGIMLQLIRRRTHLKRERERFSAEPGQMGRILMTKLWR